MSHVSSENWGGNDQFACATRFDGTNNSFFDNKQFEDGFYLVVFTQIFFLRYDKLSFMCHGVESTVSGTP